MKHYCKSCNTNNTHIIEEIKDFERDNKKISILIKVEKCVECDSYIYNEKLDQDNLRKAIEEFNITYAFDGNRLKEFRKNRKFKQEDFSNLLGISKKSLVAYEKNYNIPPKVLTKLFNKFINEENYFETYLSNNSSSEKSTYTGFRTFKKNKLYNLLSLIGDYKTKIIKILFYMDFAHFKLYGKSITGTKYVKQKYGPYIEKIDSYINEAEEIKVITVKREFKNDSETCYIQSNQIFDDTLFDQDELVTIELVLEHLKNYKTSQLVELSHQEKGWLETSDLDYISYEYANLLTLDLSMYNNEDK